MIIKICPTCNKEFTTYPSLLKRGRGVWCSRKCVIPKKQDPITRFWNLIDKNGPNGCWIWLGAKRQGYGQFRLNGKTVMAHHFAEILKNGKLEKGQPVLHLCNNPSCVRHLKRGTQKENMEQAVREGRIAYGERHGNAILNSKQVLQIKKLRANGVSLRVIAAKFKIKLPTICDITKGRTWKKLNL